MAGARVCERWRQMVRTAATLGALVAEGFDRILFPRVCALCETAIDELPFCADCRRELTVSTADPLCPYCASTIGPYSVFDGRCHHCREDRFAFDAVLRLGAYDGALAHACLATKHLEHHVLVQALADLFVASRSAELAEEGIEIVVPIPLHFFRRMARGFDQAAHLAGRIAWRLKRPLVTGVLRRHVATTSQASLSPTERRKNVRGAFSVRRVRSMAGKTILLVDDVMTTGATCHHASLALKRAGAKRIVVGVLARGGSSNR